MSTIRHILLALTLSLWGISLWAQSKSATQVVTLTAYDEAGVELRKSYGFTFGASSNEVATTYDAIIGSHKIVAQWGNKRIEVARIAGINALYNIAKLQLTVAPSKSGLSIEPIKIPSKGKTSIGGKTQALSITSNTPFNGYNFYTLAETNATWVGLPLYSDKGHVIAMIQAAPKKHAPLHAIDLKAIDTLKNTALSLGEASYKGISVPRSLPPTPEEANAYMYLLLSSNKESHVVATAINDFLTLYPNDANGYLYQAEYHMKEGRKSEAQTAINTALTHSMQPDAIHYAWAKLLLKDIGQTTDLTQRNTLIAEVLEVVNRAYSLKAEPLYALTQADCFNALAQYAQAKEKYIEVARSPMGEPLHYLYAVQAQQHVDQDYVGMEALLTEGLNKYTKPYASVAVPFLMQRALFYQKMGKHREAVTDLLESERIAVGNADNKHFKESLYALRYQSALEAKLYQQALADAEALIELKPMSCTYRLNRAVIWAVAGEHAKAIADCEWVNKQCPENADSYMWQAIIYTEAKQKSKAKSALNKLKTLNSTLYDQLDKKYK